MTDRELLQQALDMLDDINQCSLPPTGIPLPAEIDHVMEALRARLAQPECKWVGLTDEQKKEICQEAANEDWTDLDVINATEAKLREKNG